MSDRLTTWLHKLHCCLTQPLNILKRLGRGELMIVSLCSLVLSACNANFANRDASYERDLQLAYYDLTPFLGAYYPLASTEFQVIDDPKLSQALQQSGAQVCTNPPCTVDSVLLQSYACRSSAPEQDFILLEIKTPIITLQRLYQRWTQDGLFVLSGPVSVYSPYENVQPLPNARIMAYQNPYLSQAGQDSAPTTLAANHTTWQGQSSAYMQAPTQVQTQAQPAQSTPQAQSLRSEQSTVPLASVQSKSKRTHTPSLAQAQLQTANAKKDVHPTTQQGKRVQGKTGQEKSAQDQELQGTVLFIPADTAQDIRASNSPEDTAPKSPTSTHKNDVQAQPNPQGIQDKPQLIKNNLPLQTAQNKDSVNNLESNVSDTQSTLLQNRNNNPNIKVSAVAQESAVDDKPHVSAQTSEVKNSDAPHQVNQAILIDETGRQEELNNRDISVSYIKGGTPKNVLVEEEQVAPPTTLVEDLNARIDLYKKEALQQQQQRELAIRNSQAYSELQAPAVRDEASEGKQEESPASSSTLSHDQKPDEPSKDSSRQKITVNKQSEVPLAAKPSVAQASDRQVRILEQLSLLVDHNLGSDQEIQQPLLFRLKHSTPQREQ